MTARIAKITFALWLLCTFMAPAKAQLSENEKEIETLRLNDPKLFAALQKRFPRIERVEETDDCPNCSWISVYTPDRIWACDVTRRKSIKLCCRTRHQ
jgi:hypothetical protein